MNQELGNGVMGLWQIDEKRHENGGMNIYFKFEEGRVTLMNRYVWKGISTVASATSPALLTDDTIHVLEDRIVTEKVDTPREKFTLKVNLKKTSMRYRVEGDKLLLEPEGLPHQMELPRAMAIA